MIFQGSGPVFLRTPIALSFSRGWWGSGPPVPPSKSAHVMFFSVVGLPSLASDKKNHRLMMSSETVIFLSKQMRDICHKTLISVQTLCSVSTQTLHFFSMSKIRRQTYPCMAYNTSYN